ncbi:glycosyltransferase [Dyadobacter psychrotolerans]|uniref:glycosyltransferase n=1 Tax=Dyadobacter psychrotolerans TaxID=2541721 RepID=UPI00140439BD|nr:glycosyltransferase [Dyadobacter psychrotolerans]
MKPGTILFEIAWEVCNQIGGIFTYLKSKIPVMIDTYGDDYLLVGPYLSDHKKAEFRPISAGDNSALSRTITVIRELGFDVHHGYWLLDDSRPRVLLLNPNIEKSRLNEVKTRLWEKYKLSTINSDELMDQVIGFGEILKIFLSEYAKQIAEDQDIMAHFHEWTSASCIPELTDNQVRIATVFTTHSTILGRYLAPNESNYFTNLSGYDWHSKSIEFGIETRVLLERTITAKTQVLITDSESTCRECEIFLGRKPDQIIFNGIDKRPAPRYELFELYTLSREKIDAFVKALFLPSYPVRTEKTLYFFTSGRYEYRNKGFDLTLEAMARLNGRLMQQNSELTIVLFIISKKPFFHIKPEVLEARQKYQDLRKICAQISERLGPRLYATVTNTGRPVLPNLNNLVDEELLRTWKQAVLNFKRNELPPVSTHQLEEEDEISRFCQMSGLDNKESNRVKVIYYPDFMERAKSLLGMDYQEFIKGCNLGIFPSLYEPWGYTPMETAMAGTPVITSDTSGFGQYLSEIMPEHEAGEMYLLNRKFQTDENAIQQLTEQLFRFSETFETEHYIPRATISKQATDPLCWTNLQPRYHDAYKLAFTRLYPDSGLY